jgi:sarcosine oxidase subunit gamma
MLEAFEPVLPRAMPHRRIFSIAVFRGREAALNAALGVELPVTPRRVGDYLWSGPGTWLALAEPPDLAGIAAVTEQGDGLFCFAVHGTHARMALAKLVPIDLHESAFAPDAVALTLAGHIGVRIWREGEAFVLACFRSFAGALSDALEAACEAFEGEGK